MALDRYHAMRDFEKTAEPSGQEDAPAEPSEWERKGTPRFVVQEHHATALHWDFRLERGGVLVSWAVPKGIPPDPRVNNLAVQTEDHPLGYVDFAGEIPKGEYGGGTVYLWDQGTYETVKWSDREVMVDLHGERARGRHVLFKTDGRNWMIHRMDPPEDPTRELVPDDARPLEPARSDRLPDGEGWRYLVVWPRADRVAITVEGGRCTARRSDGSDVTAAWPVLRPFGRAVGALPVVFGGQLVRTSASKKDQGNVFVEDVLWLDGHGTTPLPFDTRRTLLSRLELDGDAWRIAPVYDDGTVVLEAVQAQSLAGVLAMRGEAPADEPPVQLLLADSSID